MYRYFLIFFCVLAIFSCNKSEVNFIIDGSNEPVNIYIDENTDSLIEWAVNDLADDIALITGNRPVVGKISVNTLSTNDNAIYVGKFDSHIFKNQSSVNFEAFDKQWEKFTIIKNDNKLFIAGSDIRGTVYGIFHLAEQLGISPWKWWADVKPERRKKLVLTLPYEGIISSPSVQYRGIFLNDEDWGLQPWAAKTFEPETNDIGPKTYEQIFQLLLRLKANTIWPAMHNCTKAFYNIPGNKEMAQKYHIFIGSSHAEPMLRNNVDEWDKSERGAFNYFTNSDEVNKYWQERIEEVKSANTQFIATVGMRGIHDSRMEGNATISENVEILHTIINNQRNILASCLEKPLESIPQIFVPYKEVLELYNAGLQIPDDITLMWTDDNYGYIRRLSNKDEQKRKGGSGVYYHMSYWGRPHDYLWLSTTQPGLIWYEMTRAFHNGAQKVWIANVGDIKPGEYTMEFFLDLAWDINMVNNENIKAHLIDWAAREFGKKNACEIADVLDEYYRLAFLRKPEFMGWSRTEPTTSTQFSEFSMVENDNELQRRIDAYKALEKKVHEIKKTISVEKKDAYFQLVEYSVKGAALMNFKFLNAQKSFTAETNEDKIEFYNNAQKAYDDIAGLTVNYNELNGGKWNNMMNMKPRSLPVFNMPQLQTDTLQTAIEAESQPKTQSIHPIFIRAANFSKATSQENYKWTTIKGLGYSNSSLTLFPFQNHYFEDIKPHVEYAFELKQPGKYEIEVRCLPTHSNNFDHELILSVDDQNSKSYLVNTKGRSEEWKKNVLRNYASVKHNFTSDKKGKHILKIAVNQTGIVVDQIAINIEGQEPYYEIPN